MFDLNQHNPQILLVDDESSELKAYSFLLESMGARNITCLSDSRQALAVLEGLAAPIVFLDLNMPHLSGQQVLQQIKERFPQVPVIILTANSEVETAVECLKLGAHDYLLKPISINSFGSALRTALEIGALRNEVLSLKGVSFAGKPGHPAFSSIISQSQVMDRLFQYVEAIAPSGQPSLILGETGSGKELLASAIHQISGLAGEFVAVDVSGLDDTLFSDTLFGHAKGAYTGADKVRSGLLERAAHGTIFLDEIGDLSEVSQVKLLRLLQEGIYYPLGSDQPKRSHARVVAAANKDLSRLAGTEGGFRMDLYYRLSTHLIKVPPLRERKEDIPLLAEYLLTEAANGMRKPVPQLSRQALQLLLSHPFHGNIRELKTYLFDAVARCQSREIPESLIAERLNPADHPALPELNSICSLEQLFGNFPNLEELAAYAIDQALTKTDNNQSQAAKLLGISKQALHKRLKKRNS
jgi:DNA-binding NtrC family response regulator